MSACGISPRFRYYRYVGDESFAPHFDGVEQRGDWTSKYTFMVYLSSVEAGGETRFYTDGAKVDFAVKPIRGAALAFDQLLMHEGVAVQEGTKYVLRTDLMYC